LALSFAASNSASVGSVIGAQVLLDPGDRCLQLQQTLCHDAHQLADRFQLARA